MLKPLRVLPNLSSFFHELVIEFLSHILIGCSVHKANTKVMTLDITSHIPLSVKLILYPQATNITFKVSNPLSDELSNLTTDGLKAVAVLDQF